MHKIQEISLSVETIHKKKKCCNWGHVSHEQITEVPQKELEQAFNTLKKKKKERKQLKYHYCKLKFMRLKHYGSQTVQQVSDFKFKVKNHPTHGCFIIRQSWFYSSKDPKLFMEIQATPCWDGMLK